MDSVAKEGFHGRGGARMLRNVVGPCEGIRRSSAEIPP